MLVMPVWVWKIVAWFQRNWRWVLFPLGIAVAVLGWTRKTQIIVPSPTLDEAAEKERKLAEQAAKEEADAKARMDQKVQDADHKLETKVEEQRTQQIDEAKTLEQDPDTLNKVLTEVGKAQRSG